MTGQTEHPPMRLLNCEVCIAHYNRWKTCLTCMHMRMLTQTCAEMFHMFPGALWQYPAWLLLSLSQGTGIAQWLECQARGQKAAGLNPCRSGGRIFSRVNFLCWLLFQYLFHPRVTAVARKRPRSFWQKCRLQLNSHAPYVCGFAWSDMVHGIHRTRRDGRSFMWHQPCQSCKYTTLVDIQKRTIKKLLTHVESHASAVSLLENGE